MGRGHWITLQQLTGANYLDLKLFSNLQGLKFSITNVHRKYATELQGLTALIYQSNTFI